MYNIQAIHVIGVVVSLGLIYQSYRLVRKRRESILEFLMWAGSGVFLLAVSVDGARETGGLVVRFDGILRALGLSSGFQGVLGLTVLALFLLIFYTYVNTKNNKKEIYDMSQEIALLEYELNRTDSPTREESPEKNED